MHHGGSIDDDKLDTVKEFMQYAWHAIILLIHESRSIPKIEELLDKLEDKKLS